MPTKKYTPRKKAPKALTSAQQALLDAAAADSRIYFCSKCGRPYEKQELNFPKLQTLSYRGNNKFGTICYKCLQELFENYLDTMDEYSAMRRICVKTDSYYTKQGVENLIKNQTLIEKFVKSYIMKLGTYVPKKYSYDDTLDEEAVAGIQSLEELRKIRESEGKDPESGTSTDNENDIPEVKSRSEDGIDVTEQMVKDWGFGFSKTDYQYLENQLIDWKVGYAIDGKSQESIVREICVFDLQKSKSLAKNDMETFQKLCNDRQKALDRAKLSPKTSSDADRLAEKPIGVMLQMIENEEPITEPLEQFRDVDGIQKLVRVYFIGHLCHMLGLKNRFAKEYEEEMARYTVTIPELENSDTEDIFDYLTDNGLIDSAEKKDTGEEKNVGEDGGE